MAEYLGIDVQREGYLLNLAKMCLHAPLPKVRYRSLSRSSNWLVESCEDCCLVSEIDVCRIFIKSLYPAKIFLFASLFWVEINHVYETVESFADQSKELFLMVRPRDPFTSLSIECASKYTSSLCQSIASSLGRLCSSSCRRLPKWHCLAFFG